MQPAANSEPSKTGPKRSQTRKDIAALGKGGRLEVPYVTDCDPGKFATSVRELTDRAQRRTGGKFAVYALEYGVLVRREA